jgi:hypothetical protein
LRKWGIHLKRKAFREYPTRWGEVGGFLLSDPMTRITKATMDLKKFTSVFNYWTFLVIVIYIVLLLGSILFPTTFGEPFLAIVAGITLFFLIIAFLAVLFIKDTQKAILFTIIRALIGALLPIALIALSIGPLNLYIKLLGVALVLVGLIILYFLLRPLLTMNSATKELMKGQKSE